MSDAGRRAAGPHGDETVEVSGATAGEDPLDRLAEEFAEGCRRGESPSVAAFADRHPEHAGRLRELLPTVAMMEQLKRHPHALKGREAARPAHERLGEFRILRELGRGGMGVVYEAVQEPLGRHIALKVIHQVHADARRLLRFRREAQAIAQLHHTNIVPIYAVGEHDGLPFYAMQYIRGEGLDALLGRWRGGGAAGPDEALRRWRFAARVGLQAAEAIQHAHDQGVLHRDIKPANLLIDEDEAVWVTDFGLAKLAGHDDLTASGDVIGTLRYLAPEALHGETGPRGDVYSLGLTLYEMLTLRPPFGDLTPSQLLHKVGQGQLARPSALDPAIPRDLETVVLKASARDPGHRYASAAALGDDLRRYLEDRPILARPASAVERAWRWSRRNRATATLMAIAAGALLLAAVVGLVGFASTSRALAKAKEQALRADANAAIPLDFIVKLVDKISEREEASRSNPGPPPFLVLGPRGDGPSPRPEGLENGPRPLRPGMFGGPAMAGDPEILRSIVQFYDDFATRPDIGPALQAEAAWALFKLGGHAERRGEHDKAEAQCDRALGIFEGLASRHPDDTRYFARLAKLPDMIDPESVDLQPKSDDPRRALGRIERRIRRIGALLDRLSVARPDEPGLARARMRERMKLGVVLRRTGRPDEAQIESQAAVELAEELLGRALEDDTARIDLLEARFSLARLQMGLKLHNLAWVNLQEAATELRSPTQRAITSTVIADYLEAFEDQFRGLGEAERADKLGDWSDVVDPRPPKRFGGKQGPSGPPGDSRDAGREGGPGPVRWPRRWPVP